MTTFAVVLCGGSPWGFRITGGREFDEPITVSKINPNSKACNEGVKVGDVVTEINGQTTRGLSYADAQQVIKNATQQLLLRIDRGEKGPNVHLNGAVPASTAPRPHKVDTGQDLNSDVNVEVWSDNTSTITPTTTTTTTITNSSPISMNHHNHNGGLTTDIHSNSESRWSERGPFEQRGVTSPDMWSKRPTMPTASPKPQRHSIKPLALFQTQPASGFGNQTQPASGFGIQTQPISGFGTQGSRPSPQSQSHHTWGRGAGVGGGSVSPQGGANARGMNLFRRQQEKLAQLGADVQVVEGAADSFTHAPSEPFTSSHEKPPDYQVNGLKSPSFTSSKRGVWSPGVGALSPSSVKSEPVGKSFAVSSPPESSLKNIPAVWKPGGSGGGAKKEFRPVRLNTNAKPAERKASQDSLPKPEESYAWQPRRTSSTSDSLDGTHLPTASLKYTPMTTATTTLVSPDTKPAMSRAGSRGQRMGDHSGTNGSGGDGVFHGHKDDGEIHLPSTQSPYITLLQKSRENETQGDLNFNHIGSKKPIMVSSEGHIPRGAQYLGEKVTVDGNQQHTDTFYSMPTEEKTITTKTVEHKPVVYEGIGPVDTEGVPLAFRKNVTEENQHDWYKQMYKSLHRTDKKEDRLGINDMIDSIFEKAVNDLSKLEENKYRPTYKFPDDISDTKSEEDFNPYRPSYERTVKSKADDSGYRSEPEGRHTKDLFRRHRSTSEREPREPRRNFSSGYWAPASVRSKIDVYRVQPRSIVDYEPGFSSIAFQETKTGNQFNPPIDKPGELSQYSVGGARHPSGHDERQEGDGADPREQYKKVQSGGDIPAKGLQKPAPDKPRVFKHQTTDAQRQKPQTGVVDPERERRRRQEEEAYRKKRLEELYEEERQKKMERDKMDTEARRHHDYFMNAQRSPISPNRFDDSPNMGSPGIGSSPLSPAIGSSPLSPSQPGSLGTLERKDQLSVPPERRRGFQLQGKARALYNFNAQNPRELSFRKNDIIYLHRQVDKNWFEGERHGRLGIFPSNYVEVVTSIEAARAAAMQAEGQGRARYNFTAQSTVELSLRKGEFVVLLRHVDDNWYEGRIGNRQGIFPISYVEVTRQPSTPLITPAPSVITTPMTGTPEMLSPVGYDAAPTPPPQPSPSALAAHRSPSGPYGYRQQGPVGHFFPSDPGSGSAPLLAPAPSVSRQQINLSRTEPDFSNPRSPVSSARSPTKSPISPGARLGSPLQGKRASPGPTPSFGPAPSLSVDIHSKAKPYTNGQARPGKVADDDLAVTRYRAVYAYRPQNEDELELREGDEIFVMEKCDDGWYVGTSNRTGSFGTFPGNYVQKI